VRFFVTERKIGVLPGGSMITSIVTTTSPNKFMISSYEQFYFVGDVLQVMALNR
jgi:hypothetical protein